MTQHKRPSQKARVLALLREAGARGVRTNEFLAERLPRFGARIYELRNEGHVIRGRPDPQAESGKVYRYAGFDAGTAKRVERRQRTADRIEDRLLTLAETFPEGTRLAITVRTRPASPVTRWTIQAAPENAYPRPGDVWIGETLDEAVTSAEKKDEVPADTDRQLDPERANRAAWGER